ncbi:hypothetical protein OSTOST_25872, partial [Ostertagia ostertagi]
MGKRSKRIARRCRESLSYFSLSCDDKKQERTFIKNMSRRLLAYETDQVLDPLTSQERDRQSFRKCALHQWEADSEANSADVVAVLVAMMMVVDATGLALIPWDRLSVLIVVGVTWFFKFFIV